MLQQTQVATVLARFYHPFLQTFPTVQHLAAAPRDAVMKAWEGLGYYRRAGFLHEAAKRAHNGLPTDVEGLRALPGIGKNTAHAIAAFAYRQPVAILEANVKRVVARVFAWEKPSENDLWAGAEALLNVAEPFHYNQAMMDFGSMVCTPRAPDCGVCPANAICKGTQAPERYPTPKAKKQMPVREMVITVKRDATGKLYLEKRSDALLGGLYGFPQTILLSSPRRRGSQVSAHAALDSRLRGNDSEAGIVTHTYSHFKLIGHVVIEHIGKPMHGEGWYSPTEIAALPLSGVDHKVLALVTQRNTVPKPAAKASAKRMTR
jgi:A/G-specific adenine glycosylase